jgi:PelA/Pel-15E family pectate lyase
MTNERIAMRRFVAGKPIARLSFLAAAAVGLASSTAMAEPGKSLKQPDAWFAGNEARQIAANILSWQTESGGWPKNENTTAGPYTGDRQKLKATYDNRATTDELRFLARMYATSNDVTYRVAFERGLDYVLQGQYANGGWPQSYPPGAGYHRHITFNDDAMVRLMGFVREVATAQGYAFVDDTRRKRAAAAFDRGLACILKCQIRVNDKPTVWCAQHDEIDFRPRPGRTFELATLSGSESVGITRLLMELDDPSPEVVRSVEGAVAWFEKAKLTGLRVVSEKDEKGPKGVNKVVVKDPSAPPLWARFYDIETNQPVFADRDGVAKPALADIGYERRNGYAWYGTWPQKLLDVEYPAWKKRIEAQRGAARENGRQKVESRQNAECGIRSSEFGARNSELGIRNDGQATSGPGSPLTRRLRSPRCAREESAERRLPAVV